MRPSQERFIVHQGYAAGKELVELEKELDLYSRAIGKLKQRTTELLTKVYHQSVLNLMGRFSKQVSPSRRSV